MEMERKICLVAATVPPITPLGLKLPVSHLSILRFLSPKMAQEVQCKQM